MVSVILPNYNHARFLDQRISSIITQTYKNFELIILDDCSTDNSREVIEQYRNHPKLSHIVYNEKNSGSPFIQWRKGIELAKGDFIWIAESDDFSDSRFLEVLLPEFSDEEIGIAFCSSFWIDESGNKKEDLSLFNESFKKQGNEVYIRQLVHNCVIQNVSSVLLRKRFIGNYIEKLDKFKYSGDWMFYADVLTRCSISYVNLKLNYFRWYHNNTSNQAVKLGKWTDEGVHVLRFLPKVNSVSYKRIYNLYRSWSRRIGKIPDPKRRFKSRMHLLTYCAKGVFYLSAQKFDSNKG
jgi:glycosyltransferase involved in cell wall biosynthesis